MKFGKLLGLFLALGFVCSTAANAQFSIYGEYSATRLSGMPCIDPDHLCSGSVSNAEGSGGQTFGTSHVNTTGGWGGVTYDFKTLGPARLGIDLRAGEGHSNKSGVSYAGSDGSTTSQHVLAGLKATFHTPMKSLKPYGQFSLGWARSNAAEPFGQSTDIDSPVPPRKYDSFIEYEGIVGLDIRIVSMLDLRLPELAIGNMNMMGSTSTATTTSIGVKSVAVGIVLHLPSFPSPR